MLIYIEFYVDFMMILLWNYVDFIICYDDFMMNLCLLYVDFIMIL